MTGPQAAALAVQVERLAAAAKDADARVALVLVRRTSYSHPARAAREWAGNADVAARRAARLADELGFAEAEPGEEAAVCAAFRRANAAYRIARDAAAAAARKAGTLPAEVAA